MVFQTFALLPWLTVQQNVEVGLETRGLPAASVDGLSGLAEILQRHDGHLDFAELTDELGLEVDDLLPLTDALELLGFAAVKGSQITLTDQGLAYSAADVQTSKQIFATAAIEVPLVRFITTSLRNSVDGSLRAGFFRDVLAHHYTSEQVTQQLDAATGWGRYAEL
ncbi:hypothetical protein HNR40_010344 [Nonomuraea endophytica]|uniref:Uncharacterized protein n=2 Tax=Nonomuraea endophytica TaxID=714136 RepID=A0A7W8EMW5_9ACTN|nr:hypothetical protein [Nonomuraea endophytica]